MALNTYQEFTITNFGLTQTFDLTTAPDVVYIKGSPTLANNVSFSMSVQPPNGWQITYIVEGGSINLNGHTFQIEGVNITQEQLSSPEQFKMTFVMYNGDWMIANPYEPTFHNANAVSGEVLIDDTVSLDKLENLATGSIITGQSSRPTALDAKGSGKLLIGDGTNLNSVSVTGDVTINSSGVTAIGTGVIVNADINASAAIARSKVALGTADYVVINSNTGALSQEAQLATTRGGTGINSSGSTGFPVVNAGVWSITSPTEIIVVPVSFEAGEQCNNSILAWYPGKIIAVYTSVTKALAGTDDGSLVVKINSTTIQNGNINMGTGSALNSETQTTSSADNTFAYLDNIKLVTSKTTAGGKALVTLVVERTS